MEEEFILAIGNDNSRDWETLIDSWDKSLPRLKIVTSKPLNINKSNIQIIKETGEKFLTDKQIRSLYNGSRLVVVPLKETIQPSGQSVCLQAMSCGKPVIISKISGLWDYSKLIHKENVFLTQSENSSLLNESIKELLSDKNLQEKLSKNGRELVNKMYNIKRMSMLLRDYLDQISYS